ncbi:MAG: YHS domain-containing (seleno)protein [Pseudomonadota bacterium]
MDRRQFILSGLATGLTLTGQFATAGGGMVCATDGVALDGFDSVSYFAPGGPVPGRRDIALMWKGATWYFATHRHRDMFEAKPRALSPRYGGYCALDMTQGRLSRGSPQSWQVAQGRLYLIRDETAHAAWQRDMAGNIARADAHWPAALRQQQS